MPTPSALPAARPPKPHRQALRRCLWRWGRALTCCAQRQEELATLAALLDPAADGPVLSALRRRYAQAADQLLAACNQDMAFLAAMDAALDLLSPDQQRVLRLRYRQGCRWDAVARKLCFSVQHVKRLEAMALDRLAQVETKGDLMHGMLGMDPRARPSAKGENPPA